jgi:sec-independent protein translocase protein TatC
MDDPASPGDDEGPQGEGTPGSDAGDGNVGEADPGDGITELEDITGVGPTKADALREAGFTSVAEVRTATTAELSEASGVGEKLASRIRGELGRGEGGTGTAEGPTDGTEDGLDTGDVSDDGTDEGDDRTDEEDDRADEGDDGDREDDAEEDGGEGDQSEATENRNGGEIEPVQDRTDGEIEPIQDDGGGLLGYGKAGGPEADEEMPLTAHIEEMIKRLVIVAVVAGVVSVMLFPFADRVINFLWNSILPTGAGSEFARPRLYSVLEFWFTKVKVASLAGVIVGLPVFVYQTYRFMRPGLYPNERRYYLAAVPTSLVLALVGVAFAYFIVLPSVFTYFLYYSESVTTIGFALGRTFNLILIMMAYLAVVFQIPLFILLAMLMGIVTRRWLAERRLIFWGAFLGISFVFSPDPTGMVPILITLTMIALFEGTLLLTKWTRGRGGGGESGVGA